MLVSNAQPLLERTAASGKTSLPEKDYVRFNFLTNKGRYIADEHTRNFENQSSPWMGLFEDANRIITEYRAVTRTIEH
jgi:hypothetical protein